MALGAGTLTTARGVALSGWQRRAQLLAPPTLDSLEPPGWLGARLDFGFPAPPLLLEARAGAARVGSHWQSCDCPPELLITCFGVGESISNRVRLLGLASYFSLGKMR